MKRWNEGCHSAKRLYEEICEQGYSHSIDTVKRLLSNLRCTEEQGKKLSHTPKARHGSIAGTSPTARNVAALFMRREERLNEEQREYLKRLAASDPTMADAHHLTQKFAEMVRGLEGEKLDEWLGEAGSSKAVVTRRFAVSLKKDLAAVRAGLTERWSNGSLEAFFRKLKLLKRQGHGRAGFDLLRARILAA